MSVFPIKRKDGTQAWYYDFTINGIRYRQNAGATKTQALRAQEKKRGEVLEGNFGLQKIRNTPIKEFAKIFLKRREHLRSYKRDDLSVRTLLKFFKGKFLSGINPSDIEDYIGYRMSQGVSNATINRELACLKRMFTQAIKWGDASQNPVKQVDFLDEPPGRTRFLSLEEAQRLINSCPEHLSPIVITALNTGMRLMEILTLQWKQVHIDNVVEPYIEVIMTKNNQKRFIELNDDMVKLLKGLDGNGSNYVFLGSKCLPLQSVKKPFATALNRANIEDFRFHDLRHTFASHYLMSGGDLMSLKEILGHSSMKMVMRYAHLARAYKRKMVNNLNGSFTKCQIYAKSEDLQDVG